MTLKEIRDDVLRKVWVEFPNSAPSYLFDDARTAVNQAIQTIYLSALSDDVKRRPVTVNLSGGVRRYELPANLQKMLGTARLSGNPLTESFNRGDIENYCVRFKGDMEETPGTPVAYHVESQQVDGDDAISSWLWVAPTPIEDGEFSAYALFTAPRYSLSELASSAIPDVPHGYVESLLLPLARYYITRSSWFNDESKQSGFEADAAAALEHYGIAAPWRMREKENSES